MTTKGITTPGSAYETFPGVTAKEATDLKLAVVETAFGGGSEFPVYGRYLNTETGAAVEMTTGVPAETRVVPAGTGAGGVSLARGNDKGSLVNQNDPVIHGTAVEGVHADGSAPLEVDSKAEHALLAVGSAGPAAPAKTDAKTKA